ncbi:MAG: T9SS type A sorting domain-containing protein, partial [Candidatus Cloacimonetes bacterium]|nr:T9SS type A sorting domain-containing protein [Candidatus Cloacimonadota bacterium]
EFYQDLFAGMKYGHTYEYKVSAVYGYPIQQSNFSTPVDIRLIRVPPMEIEDGFEDYADFSTNIGDWQTYDVDGSNTEFFPMFNFPGEGNPTSFIVFNPTETVPPSEDFVAYCGSKVVVCPPSVDNVNDDWLITHPIHVDNTLNSISFVACSVYTSPDFAQLEILISNSITDSVDTFVPLGLSEPFAVPHVWTYYEYSLEEFCDQDIRIAFHCISDNSAMLSLDNVIFLSETTESDENIEENPFITALNSNYPNSFNPETKIDFSLDNTGRVTISVYNIKGQLVKTLINSDLPSGKHSVIWSGDDMNKKQVSSGVYFYRMQSKGYLETRKMLLLK